MEPLESLMFGESPKQSDKVDANFPCVHTKVYQNVTLTSNPPQRNWICSKCMETGIDQIAVNPEALSYEQLIANKNQYLKG